MQFSKIIASLALAATASCAAVALEPRTGGSSGSGSSTTSPCDGNNKAVCCNGVLGLLDVSCNLDSSCSGGNAYCCSTNEVGLINLNVFSCGSIL
ncbi:hypothetical protein P280DRAFT_514985 [Massarina eburnea CBS 473.64]|uniref:Hydrophobin n=1 Tax=Massarina eburnea CBS 473.64 TaxID=1395130 RepID=A0A6A6SAZ3_9PLEO|nr:hypothetical protein P280DRAFT_514985 [Massarina eburnea CBS 473.64]